MDSNKLTESGKWYAEFDGNGVCTGSDCDAAYRRLLGFSPDEEYANVREKWLASIHPDDAAKLDALLEDTVRRHPEGMDYDIEYRMMTVRGYRWFHDYGRCARREDGALLRCDGVVFDIQDSVDRDEAYSVIRGHEKFLGAVPLSSDILAKSNIGLWAFELDEGRPPRMYADETMLRLLGLDRQETPEEIYHAWYDNVDTGSYGLVAASVEKMTSGEPSEVQYPWHHPDGRTVIVRCGGTRNPGYTAGIRIEGTHRDVTEVIRFDEEIQKKEREDLSLFLISALSDSYSTLYYIDPKSGEYQLITRDNEFGNKVNARLAHGGSFYEDCRQSISRVVFAEDAEKMEVFLDREKLEKAFGGKDTFSIDYRLVIEGNPVWYRVKAVRLPDEGSGEHFALGIMNIEEQLMRQRQLEESLTFTNFFLDTYVSAYYINLDTRDCRVYKRTAELEAEYPIAGDYFESLSVYINNDVHPDDRAELLEASRPEKMKELLRKNAEYTHSFRDISGGKEKIYRMQVIRGNDESHAAFGFEDITKQMNEQQQRLLGAIPLSSAVFSKARIGMWAFELDEGKAPRMYADDTMLELLGLEHRIPPEEIYHAWYDRIDDGMYDLVADAVEKMVSGEHAEVQYPWHHPDGHTMIVRCGGTRNPEYKAGIRVEGTHQDVSETLHFDDEVRRKAKQQELELITSRLRADSLAYIADNDPDLDSAIDFFGKRTLEISGCDQIVYRDIDGRRIVLNRQGSADIPEAVCAGCPFSNVSEGIGSDEGMVVINDSSESWNGLRIPEKCPVRSSLMQHVYANGKLAGLFSVHYIREQHTFSDNAIDMMKTVARYLGLLIERIYAKKTEIARIEAESSNSAKTEFLFNMSHDIRTPMNAITGFTDKAIRNMDEPEVLKESLNKVKSSSDYLLRIINDILDMAKIESGKLELKEELSVMGTGKTSVIDVFGGEAARKGIEFTKYFDIKDRYFWMDDNRTTQIVANLLSNAIKYTEPGGKIRYSVVQVPCGRPGYGRYVATVEDTGCGISPEFLSKIFNAFEREKSAIRSGEQGTGLGMAIVKKLADAMGATVEIESELGKGTKVTFTAEHRLATPEEIEKHDAAARAETDEKPADLSGKRVLVVEDNELNREIATDILTEEGMEAETASDGSVAVEIISEKGPDYYDFVLMDIQMPVMDGFEATREIRKRFPDSDLPIIALSANAFAEDKAASLEAGMNDHVAKPINVKELETALAGCMRTANRKNIPGGPERGCGEGR